jgi:hypothetical protein
MCFEKVQNKVEKLPRWTVSDRLTHWHGGSVVLQDSYDLSDAGARLVPVDPGS